MKTSGIISSLIFSSFLIVGCASITDENSARAAQTIVDRIEHVEARDNYGRTALIKAVEDEETSLIKPLLSKGANVNAKDYQRRTPLIIAVQGGYTKIVKLLLENGASIYVKYNNALTPLMIAEISGSKKIVRLLREAQNTKLTQPALNLAFIYSVEDGDIENVRELIKQGADVNAKNSNGNTALGQAIFYDYRNIVELLLKSGALIGEKELDASVLYTERGGESSSNILKKIGTEK